ncbi:hypothetical protein OsccyDRAFT_3111 [Leptolyngbyaceae cyanobacterium JSC-12]|nr:hypothetical protein OsccyDRAFT_3111 [Leptolyngbyaceae cyanobacterium JSC-12]
MKGRGEVKSQKVSKGMRFRGLGIGFSFVLLLATFPTVACEASNQAGVQTPSALKKITFDLSQISPEGLIGSEGGLRSLSYEFCIPATAAALAEVQAIDSTVQYSRSPGRIGCKQDQYLVIGHTHQYGWRVVLTNLVNLDYVQRIDQFWGE